jgi:hypothetical protein
MPIAHGDGGGANLKQHHKSQQSVSFRLRLFPIGGGYASNTVGWTATIAPHLSLQFDQENLNIFPL